MSMQRPPTKAPGFVPGDPLPGAPALSFPGPFCIGVQTRKIPHLPHPARSLTLELWYPAEQTRADIPALLYHDQFRGADGMGASRDITIPGRALRNGAALSNPAGLPWPLVLVSHGFAGTRYLMSYLGEHLASHGYVVAAMDHPDPPGGSQDPAVAASMVLRSLDQKAALDGLEAMAKAPEFPKAWFDPSKTALIALSMGGFGALRTLGAGYGPALLQLAGPGASPLLHNPEHKADPRIGAAVLFAPWGGAYGLWEPAALEQLAVPTLWLTGSHDDIAGYAAIRSLFDQCRNSCRHILTYQQGRHNIAGNPPPECITDTNDWFHWGEPVWDNRRLNNLNQHFVTAFLNARIKGDQDSLHMLDVPCPSAGDSGAPGEQNWPGFQARTALGMTLEYRPAGT